MLCSEAEKIESEYEIRINAHEDLCNYDIVEAIEENFFWGVKDRNVSKDDTLSSILVHNLDQGVQDN